MGTKTLSVTWPETGQTLYAVLHKLSDGQYYDNSTNLFTGGAVTTIEMPLTADTTINRLYKVISTDTWANEAIAVIIYKQVGGSVSVSTDTIIAIDKITPVVDAGNLVLHAPSTEGIWNNDVRTITSISNVTTGIILDKTVLVEGDNAFLQLFEGNNKTLTISLGTNWPLTGKLVNIIGKSALSEADGSAAFDKSVAIIDADNGIGQVTLTATDLAVPALLFVEVEVSDDPGGGNPETAQFFKLDIRERVFD